MIIVIGLIIVYILFILLLDMKVAAFENVRKRLRLMRILEYKIAFSEKMKIRRKERLNFLNKELENVQKQIEVVDFWIEQFS